MVKKKKPIRKKGRWSKEYKVKVSVTSLKERGKKGNWSSKKRTPAKKNKKTKKRVDSIEKARTKMIEALF